MLRHGNELWGNMRLNCGAVFASLIGFAQPRNASHEVSFSKIHRLYGRSSLFDGVLAVFRESHPFECEASIEECTQKDCSGSEEGSSC